MFTMKKGLVLAAAAAALGITGSPCKAEIIPPYGPGQIGYTSVVLCDTLTIRRDSSASSDAVGSLHYGDTMMVYEQRDGWAECILSDDVDAEAAGWVNADYVAIDPAWYRTDAKTTVYAWNDTAAPKVAQLDQGKVLPILKDEEDWVLVSLRGAAGWIRKTDTDYRTNTVEQNNQIAEDTDSDTIQIVDEDEDAVTAYAEDGSAVTISWTGGRMYEDAGGRTYVSNGAGIYYCMETDTTYAENPDVWTSGETGFDQMWSGEDFGENPDYEYEETEWTGEDFGEIVDEEE